MTLGDLFFIPSVLLVLVLCGAIAAAALRRKWDTTRRSSRFLGLFVAAYAAALICVSLATPRRFYPPGERRCFDDWCVTALAAEAADDPSRDPCGAAPGARGWVVGLEVTSVAIRVNQRAPDAWAELEDLEGRRYGPCAAPLARGATPARVLADEIAPGESFRVFVPYRIPINATPTGVVFHHGDIPGIVVIGADHSFLHRPALQRIAVDRLH